MGAFQPSADETHDLGTTTSRWKDVHADRLVIAGASNDSSLLTCTIGGHLTIGATDGNQTLDVASHDEADGGLKLAGTLVKASAAELNILDGVTATTTELNYVDGVTSAIQTQLDAKASLASPALTGTATAENLTLSGNLTVNGTTTTVNSTTVTVDDPIFTLGGDTAPTSDDNKDRGIEFRWHPNDDGTDGAAAANIGFFGYDNSTGYFTFIPDATNNSEVFSGTKGTVDVAAVRLPDSGLFLEGTAVTSTATELNLLDGAAITTDELNILDGHTAIGTTAVIDAHGIVMNQLGTMVQIKAETLSAYLDDKITAMPNLASIGKASATTNFAAGDVTIYDTTENSHPTLSIGSSSTENLTIRAFNDGTAVKFVDFISKTASDTADHGKFRFYVDELKVLEIKDDGLVTKNGGTIGIVADEDLLTLTSGVLTVAGEISVTTLDIGGTNVTATATELNYTDGVTSNIQAQLDAKQASDAQLTDIAGLAVTDGGFIVGDGSNFVLETSATARTSLGLGTGDSPQFTKLTLSGSTTADTDAATKSYVDSVAQGLSAKDSVRAATTANGTLASAYENGQAIDGVTLATNDRILIKNQTSSAENGIYTVNASGAPTRAVDFDANAEVAKGAFVFVEEGTTNANAGFVLTTDGSITLGTTDLAFTQFSGAGQITAGTGLTKSGNELSLTENSITFARVGGSTSDISLGSTVSFQGTSNEVSVGLNAGVYTIGLHDDVTIGQDLTVTRNLMVNGTLIKSDNTLHITSPSSLYFNIDSDNNSTVENFYWRSNLRAEDPYADTLMKLDESGNLSLEASGATFTAPNLSLSGEVQYNVTDATGSGADHTVADGDHIIIHNTAHNINLPAAANSNAGRELIIVNTSTTIGPGSISLTVNPNGDDEIFKNGGANSSLSVTARSILRLISTGEAWYAM